MIEPAQVDPLVAIDRLRAAFRGPDKHRTLHAKGRFYAGTFTATPEATPPGGARPPPGGPRPGPRRPLQAPPSPREGSLLRRHLHRHAGGDRPRARRPPLR